MANAFFKSDFNDFFKLRESIEKLGDEIDEVVHKVTKKVASNIRDAQRRYAPENLGNYIQCSVTKTKKGVYYAESGYNKGTFEGRQKTKTPGYRGTVLEYGVPGQSPNRKGNTYKIKLKSGGTKIIEKTPMAAQPHIRRGFDETLEQNIQTVADAIEAAAKNRIEGGS